MSSAPLPDAGANWVDRHAPERLKPWLKLGRFDRPIGIWLLLLPGWSGIALALSQYRKTPALYDVWLVVAFALGACLMRAAGCAFNDIVDRDIDARVARTALRPIPAGQISVKQAWAFVIGCSMISLLILLTLNLTAVLLGVGSLALVAAYPFMKRITWWPQAWLGLTFNWTLGYDTIYALQDIEDDAMVGVKSSARRLGGNVQRGVGIFYLITVILTVAAGLTAGLGPIFYVALLPWAAHLFRQARDVRADNPVLALRLFRSNREAGLILLLAIILGTVGWPT